eukprot:351026-Chlamydomonas_euryale.AAC.3
MQPCGRKPAIYAATQAKASHLRSHAGKSLPVLHKHLHIYTSKMITARIAHLSYTLDQALGCRALPRPALPSRASLLGCREEGAVGVAKADAAVILFALGHRRADGLAADLHRVAAQPSAVAGDAPGAQRAAPHTRWVDCRGRGRRERRGIGCRLVARCQLARLGRHRRVDAVDARPQVGL